MALAQVSAEENKAEAVGAAKTVTIAHPPTPEEENSEEAEFTPIVAIHDTLAVVIRRYPEGRSIPRNNIAKLASESCEFLSLIVRLLSLTKGPVRGCGNAKRMATLYFCKLGLLPKRQCPLLLLRQCIPYLRRRMNYIASSSALHGMPFCLRRTTNTIARACQHWCFPKEH